MKVVGTEVRLFGLDDIDEEYVAASDAVLFGAPTYYAGVAWQMIKFFHETQISFAGKLGAAFSTAGYEQGGSEVVLSDIISFMMAKGMRAIPAAPLRASLSPTWAPTVSLTESKTGAMFSKLWAKE